MFIGYVEARAQSCFRTVDCGFNIDGCRSVCRSRGCSGSNSRCVGNSKCCCNCGGYGK